MTAKRMDLVALRGYLSQANPKTAIPSKLAECWLRQELADSGLEAESWNEFLDKMFELALCRLIGILIALSSAAFFPVMRHLHPHWPAFALVMIGVAGVIMASFRWARLGECLEIANRFRDDFEELQMLVGRGLRGSIASPSDLKAAADKSVAEMLRILDAIETKGGLDEPEAAVKTGAELERRQVIFRSFGVRLDNPCVSANYTL